jgi:hypothetical protein
LLTDMGLGGWGLWEGRVRVMIKGVTVVDVACGECYD